MKSTQTNSSPLTSIRVSAKSNDACVEGNPGKMRGHIKILLVDDHPVVRRGIGSCLSQHSHLLIAGEAADGFEAVAKAKELLPDIMLLDLDLPQMSGLAVAETLRKDLPNLKVLYPVHVPAR